MKQGCVQLKCHQSFQLHYIRNILETLGKNYIQEFRFIEFKDYCGNISCNYQQSLSPFLHYMKNGHKNSSFSFFTGFTTSNFLQLNMEIVTHLACLQVVNPTSRKQFTEMIQMTSNINPNFSIHLLAFCVPYL